MVKTKKTYSFNKLMTLRECFHNLTYFCSISYRRREVGVEKPNIYIGELLLDYYICGTSWHLFLLSSGIVIFWKNIKVISNGYNSFTLHSWCDILDIRMLSLDLVVNEMYFSHPTQWINECKCTSSSID